MAHRLTIARASQLVGVHRSVLQQRVREGSLACDEGMVSAEELQRVFPDVEWVTHGDLERVARIQEESFGRRVRERTLPSQEVLAQRVFAQSQELADARRHLQRYHALVQAVRERLGQAAPQHPPSAALLAFTDDELARLLAIDAAGRFEVLDAMLGVMSPHVVLQPGGHEYFAEGRDTLLEAGLKAGLALAYGCGNGSCGLCKARVLDGEVRQVRHHDYPLSQAERAQGHVLMCCSAPVTDVRIEALVAAGPADIPEQQVVATVRAVTPLAPATMLLHVQTPRTARLRFLAGQGVRIGTTGALGDASALHPIASCPCDDRNIQFHVGLDPSDPIARRLHAGALRVGDSVTITGPYGRFALDVSTARPLVFAACDLGFAPVKSLVEHALASEAATSCAVLWLATRADGHYLANLCRAWTDSLDRFAYHGMADPDPATGAERLVDRWAESADAIAGECDVFVAGPSPFVAAASDAFHLAGVNPSRLHTEILER
ncbi:MAG: 2Fe-2S iron-sulfur cluster binding domain-containing protein [Betaproteobacteria bacterium]|nr:2Fe-2S iron-sulfur cluster binding domain-containing protein [Betaproteobacteria bacterium]